MYEFVQLKKKKGTIMIRILKRIPLSFQRHSAGADWVAPLQ